MHKKKSMFSQVRRFIPHEGLWLPFILLAAGLIMYLSGDKNTGNILLLIGAGSGLGWYVNWLWTRRNITKPLAGLVANGEAIITKDSVTLTDALAALAQGNLTAQVRLDAQSLTATSDSHEVRQLASLLNISMQRRQSD